MSSVTSSSTSSTSTPKPRLDLFNDSPRLVAKKCRTSTPSLRPPKPPTKSTSSTRRCRSNIEQQGQRRQQQFFPSRQLNKTNSSYFFFHHHNNNSSFRHDGSFSFGLRDNSIFEEQYQDESRLYKYFNILEKIGSGNFGDVYRVESKTEDHKQYAIKRTLMPFTSEADRRRKYHEVENHQMLPPHDNCVKYYDSWEEDGYLYIQTELCQSNLNQIIERQDENKLPEPRVWKYLINLLSAVKHLHDNNLLHLDIKPDNIFISFDDKAKLGDFGLMSNCSDQNISYPVDGHSLKLDPDDSEEGDSKYLAKEAMQGTFTKAADIYSLGITMFEAASGMDLPQGGEIYQELRQNNIDDVYLNGLSVDLVYVIKKMMESDYRKRPLVDELLQLDVVRARLINHL